MNVQKKEFDISWLIKQYKNSFDIDIEYLAPHGAKTVELRRDATTDIQQFHPGIVGDDKFYQALSHFDWYYQEFKAEFLTASRVTHGRSVCEIGSGAGYFAKYSGATEYVGLELNSRSVDLAKSNSARITTEESVEHLARVGKDRYDVVCAFQVLEHVIDPEAFVKTAVDLVKPDGWVVFSVPADDSFVGLVPNNILNMPPHHQTRWSDRALELLGPRHGLITIAIVHENLDSIHYDWAQTSFLRAGAAGGRMFRAVLARLGRAIFKNLRNTVARALKGHTVTVIYRKSDA